MQVEEIDFEAPDENFASQNSNKSDLERM